MILITGASGNAGGAVLHEVLKSGSGVRALYRSKEDAAKAAQGATAVIADKQSLRRALEGVDTVYLVCSPVRELVELENNMLDACREAGVKHVVLNSALGAGDFPKSFPIGTAKWKTNSRHPAWPTPFCAPMVLCRTLSRISRPPFARKVRFINPPETQKSATSICAILQQLPAGYCSPPRITRVKYTN